MKKEFWYHLLFVFDLAAILLFFGKYFLLVNNYPAKTQETFMPIYLSITFISIIFWIWNIIIWSKKDKKMNRLIALIILNGFYTPYYYTLVIKNNWLKNK
jgi:hypothetical protein